MGKAQLHLLHYGPTIAILNYIKFYFILFEPLCLSLHIKSE